jgi:hypothetical protein
MDQASRDEKVVIRAPRGAAYAIERAAIQAHMTPGELARRLLLDGLRANGFDLAEQDLAGSGHGLPFRGL